MKTFAFLLAAAGFVLAAPPIAAGEHDRHAMGHDQPAKPIRATGDVRALKANLGKIKLRHDPIPALDWPEMVMDFKVADKKLLSGLKVGDRVEFSMEKARVGYTITAIDKTK